VIQLAHCPKKSLIHCLRRQTTALTRDWNPLVRGKMESMAATCKVSACRPDHTPHLPSGSVSLVVTRLPGLQPFDYQKENWIRCWFIDLDLRSVPVIVPPDLATWKEEMARALAELSRVIKWGGHLAVEISRLRPRNVNWDELIMDLALATGFKPVGILINSAAGVPEFTGKAQTAQASRFDKIMLFRKPTAV
jgi:hypothetical protein